MIVKSLRKSMVFVLGVLLWRFPCSSQSVVFFLIIPPLFLQSTASDSTLFEHLINIWEFNPGPTPGSCDIHFVVDFKFQSPLYSQVRNPVCILFRIQLVFSFIWTAKSALSWAFSCFFSILRLASQSIANSCSLLGIIRMTESYLDSYMAREVVSQGT